MVIGDVGAVHCKSSKQSIVTKSSTEAELIALSDSANQGLYTRNFLITQGCKMEPVINTTYCHPELLDTRESKRGGSGDSAQGDEGNVC